MSAFLISWLSKRYAALDATVFLREQPGDWLVLEPQPGEPARGAEPLAVRLAVKRNGTRFTVGRDPASDFVVNDPRVALSHAVLQPDEDGGWTLRRASDDVAVRLDGLALGDFPVGLGSGARIDLSGVRLTYYAGGDFLELLKRAA